MNLESLLMCSDPETVRVLLPALEKLSIEVKVCRGARAGQDQVNSEKFDAVIVDCDDLQGGTEVLRGLRRTPSNQRSAAFAIVNGKTSAHQAFEMGANFVLQKPVSALSAVRCFSAALNMMERERRRYFRYPVDFPVVVVFGEGQQLKANTTNVSEGGMAIRVSGKLASGAISRVIFTLPGTSVALETTAEVAWSNESGLAGVRFTETPVATQEGLERWLAERILQMAEVAASEPQNSKHRKDHSDR